MSALTMIPSRLPGLPEGHKGGGGRGGGREKVGKGEGGGEGHVSRKINWAL